MFYDANYMTPEFKLSLHGFACRLFMDCETQVSPIPHPFIEGTLAWITMIIVTLACLRAIQGLSIVVANFARPYGHRLDFQDFETSV